MAQNGQRRGEARHRHSRSPLKAHARWLLDLAEKEPDLTLEEIRDRLCREKRLAVAASSVWRFYDRHKITFKEKSCTRPSRIDRMSPPPARS